MTDTGWIALASGILTVILIPLLVVVIRVVIRATRAEDKLEDIEGDLKDLKTLVMQIRAGLDQRLRWLEENLWKRQQRPRPPRRDPPS